MNETGTDQPQGDDQPALADGVVGRGVEPSEKRVRPVSSPARSTSTRASSARATPARPNSVPRNSAGTTGSGATSASSARKPATPRKPAAKAPAPTPSKARGTTPAKAPATTPVESRTAAPAQSRTTVPRQTAPGDKTAQRNKTAPGNKVAPGKTTPRKPEKASEKSVPVLTPLGRAAADAPVVLSLRGLIKRYGTTTAVDDVDLDVRAGSFYGIVGPNGAGKTTTLSMATGLLRPDSGTVSVFGTDIWAVTGKEAAAAKKSLGVLPDRLRLFDRLTGAQFLYYSATLRGLDGATARKRSADLADAFGLHDALGRLVSDYSVGMTKKVALAAAIIHSPRVLVLDEPFESVDPVSAATVTEILQRYVRGGGTVLLSSHSMDLVERICDSVAVIVDGHVLASGTVEQVRDGRSLEDRFVELAGGSALTEGMEWLHDFSE